MTPKGRYFARLLATQPPGPILRVEQTGLDTLELRRMAGLEKIELPAHVQSEWQEGRERFGERIALRSIRFGHAFERDILIVGGKMNLLLRIEQHGRGAVGDGHERLNGGLVRKGRDCFAEPSLDADDIERTNHGSLDGSRCPL